MFRNLLLVFSFCALISFGAVPGLHSVHRSQQTDTPKNQANIQKTIAAKKDSISKLGKIVRALIKPFKFRANEEARIRKIVEGYIQKDTANFAQQIAKLKTQMPPDESQKLESLMKEIETMQLSLQGLREQIDENGKKIPSPIVAKDSPATKPAAAAQPPLGLPNPATEAAARQKMNAIIFPLLSGPQKISNDTNKHKDTILYRERCAVPKTKIFGFYDQDSQNRINGNYFKLITTFVYASNLVDGTAPNLGRNYNVIDSARRRGCEILFSVYNSNAASTTRIMGNLIPQDTLIKRAISAVARIGAKGINIDLVGLSQQQRGTFVKFIGKLWQACRIAPTPYYISVTIPGDDKGVAYDLASLNNMVKYFIMDFSRGNGRAGALAPLNDNSSNSIQTCFSLYLSWSPYIAPSKFVLGVPYQGVQWVSTPKAKPQYLTYQQLRNRYADSAASYEPGLSAAYITVNNKNTSSDIWYDDDLTLGAKYDFALNSALGGVAIKYLGDDGTTGYLQQELTYKLIKIDTVISSIKVLKEKPSFGNFLSFLFEDPCNALETVEHEQNQHLYSKLLLWVNIILGAIIIIVAIIRFFKIKKLSSAWPYKQPFTYALIGLCAIESFFLLLFLFVWPGNPYFGNNRDHICINVPFIVLFAILVAGTAAGIILRWLYQLNYKNERP